MSCLRLRGLRSPGVQCKMVFPFSVGCYKFVDISKCCLHTSVIFSEVCHIVNAFLHYVLSMLIEINAKFPCSIVVKWNICPSSVFKPAHACCLAKGIVPCERVLTNDRELLLPPSLHRCLCLLRLLKHTPWIITVSGACSTFFALPVLACARILLK